MVSATNRGDGLPICERLTATRPRSGRPYKSDAREFINQDGPEAADIIDGLSAELEHFIDIIDGTEATGFDPHVEQMLMDAAETARAVLSLARGEVTHEPR